MEQMKNDVVNHPAHYTDGKYECIDFIESWGLGFHLGNAVKYITRAGKKNPEKTKEDLEKAIWYVKRARTYTDHFLCYPTRMLDEKNERISVYDYVFDKRLSYPLAQALLNIVRGDLDAALIHLNHELLRN